MGGLDQDRKVARLDAFRLIARAQRDFVAGPEMAALIEEADRRGWPEVVRVLLYADVVRRELAGDEAGADVALVRLHERCERDDDELLLLLARGERAILDVERGEWSDMPRIERELAEITATLLRTDGPALEKVNALVVCAIAYSSRGATNVASELHQVALKLLPECEIPVLAAVVHFNEGLLQLRLACTARAHDDPEAMVVPLEAARASFNAALVEVDGSVPEEELKLYLQLVDALEGEHREVIPSTTERWRFLELLIEAFAALDAGDWARCGRLCAESAALDTQADSPTAELTRSLLLRTALEVDAVDRVMVRKQLARLHADRRLHERRLGFAIQAMLEAEALRHDRDNQARAAVTDELTGVGNGRGYVRSLATMPLRGNEVLSVMATDLDRLKSLNTSFGHGGGDDALRRVGKVLASHVRADDFVARTGGDEFVVLMPGADRDMAYERALEISEAVREPLLSDAAGEMHLTVSIGLCTGVAADVEELVRIADEALLRGKAGGRDIVIEAPPLLPSQPEVRTEAPVELTTT